MITDRWLHPWMLAGALATCVACGTPEDRVAGAWVGTLHLAGGDLPFALQITDDHGTHGGQICNGPVCGDLSDIRVDADTIVFDIGDYDATITAIVTPDSLYGTYRNVGNRGPRSIPFVATRGVLPATPGEDALLGRWDATFITDQRRSPRVVEIRNGDFGLEGALIGNSGDYGTFWGEAVQDSFYLAHFDGSFVYLLAGRLEGDTLRGTFHAGASTQTPWVAVRSTGARHLTPPTELTRADTSTPFRFAFPDLDGNLVTQDDPRFEGKVVLIDIFGTWCPTCHDAAPVLVKLYEDYHDQGLEIVGFAYEVTGDTAIDNRQVRRYREKFGIPFPLLLAGLNVVEATAATLPQLQGFTAYPTTVFLGRDGTVKLVYAGFVGPAASALHSARIEELRSHVERLLATP